MVKYHDSLLWRVKRYIILQVFSFYVKLPYQFAETKGIFTFAGDLD
jgi:hypothetical protein